jgi:hypothetical protein
VVNKSSLRGDQGLSGEYKWGKTHAQNKKYEEWTQTENQNLFEDRKE